MDLRKIRCEIVDWINLAHDKDQWRTLVYMLMNLWVPKKGWESLDWLSDYELLRKDYAS
jgi:hypothetical protein